MEYFDVILEGDIMEVEYVSVSLCKVAIRIIVKMFVVRGSVRIKYFVWKRRLISLGRHRSFCHFVVLRFPRTCFP